MPLITDLGNSGFIWIVLTLMLLISKKYRKVGSTMLIALMLEVTVCNVILKPLIARIRPCDINTAVHLLISRPTDYSFPSGHTAASFAAASALYFSKRKFWIPAFCLAILIAFSRLYLYVHYPTDILAGTLIGIIIGYIGWKAENLFEFLYIQHYKQ